MKKGQSRTSALNIVIFFQPGDELTISNNWESDIKLKQSNRAVSFTVLSET